MTKVRDRAFAGFGAILFLVTSSALTIAVIYTLVQQSHQSSPTSTTTPPTSKATLTGTKMQNFTPTSTPQSQLQTIDTTMGSGAVVKASDTVTADYVGALMSTGVIFDASADHGGPQTFPLNGVIAGWQQGIPGMKVGGSRRLLIPASMAYGSTAQNGIPANSDLVFDVTIKAVK